MAMKITVDEDEAYYLARALELAIRCAEKHARKVRKVPDGGGAFCLTMQSVSWLRALLDEVSPPQRCSGCPECRIPETGSQDYSEGLEGPETGSQGLSEASGDHSGGKKAPF